MSTWYFMENVEIPPGTKFPCELPEGASRTIDDEGRFLDLLATFPDFELMPNGPPENWTLASGGRHLGELSTRRRPGSEGFQNPFDLMKAGLGLEAIWKLMKQGALTGLSIRASYSHSTTT